MFTVLSFTFDVDMQNLAICKLGCEFTECNRESSHEDLLSRVRILNLERVDITAKDMGLEAPTKQSPMSQMTEHIICALESRRYLIEATPHFAPYYFSIDTYIVIEQQPCGKFVNMSIALSHVIQAFFCMTAPHMPVTFLFTKRKLCESITTESTEGSKASLLSLVENAAEARALLGTCGKRDDLENAFLQGYDYAQWLRFYGFEKEE